MSTSQTRASTWEGLRIVNPHAAGLDISSSDVWAGVPKAECQTPVRQFGIYTCDLHSLADWLISCKVDTVAMESTGVYWIPVYEILQARGLRVFVVNARHLHNVPGRKSDIKDCQWLQGLHSVGLLSGSFRPAEQICALRAYLRHRTDLIEHRSSHIQHMQKALSQMNVQLGQVVSDITGLTGMSIMRAIVKGERDASKLASLRQARCHKQESEIAKALGGNYRPEHVFALKQALALYDAYTDQLRECDQQIEAHFANLRPVASELPARQGNDKPNSHSKNGPSYPARDLLYRLVGVDLVAIPGLNESTVETIISEIGTDMSPWPSDKHFCSWLHLAPHNDISGGKVLHSRVLKSHNRAGQAFRLAAQSVSRSPQSVFGAYYRRLRSRLGPQKAIVATAHKIARTFYHILKYRTPFTDLGAEEYELRARQREITNLCRRAAKLGLTITIPTTQAPQPACF